MWVAAVYMGFVGIGFFVGRKVIPKGKTLKYADKLLTGLVFLLIFLLGSGVGADERVVSSLGSIGAISLAVSVLAMVGSVLGVIGLRKMLRVDRKGAKRHE